MFHTIISAAQSISDRGDVEKNISRHIQLIGSAVRSRAKLVFFPELSLTGYEPDLARTLAFSRNDPRLTSFIDIAARLDIIVIVGAPVKLDSGLHIGSFILYPDRSLDLYTKHFLHPGEEKFFEPGNLNPMLFLNDKKISLSICADTSHLKHWEMAAGAGISIYLASVMITPGGYLKDTGLIGKYANEFNLLVMMANHGGESGGYLSAGGSAAWTGDGQWLAQFDGTGEGIVLASEKNGIWKGKVLKKCALA